MIKISVKLIAALSLIGIVACSKDGVNQKESPSPEPVPGPASDTLYFKAAVSANKSIMGTDGGMIWQSTDVVKFFDGTTTVTASPENIAGATADFTVVGLDPDAARYYAAYPADMVDSFEADGDVVFNSYGTDPQSRSNSYCAVAACPKSDEMTMSFRNVSHIFRLTRPSSGVGSDAASVAFMTLDNISVSSGVTVSLESGETPEIANVIPGSAACNLASAAFDQDGVAVLNIDPIVAANGYVFVLRDNSNRAIGIQLIPKVDGKQKSFKSGEYMEFEIELQDDPEPPTPVPPIDDLIFAPGNLYYHNGQWGFEARQYDFRTWVGYPCCVEGVYSSAAGGTESTDNIGLFYWTPDKDLSRAKEYSNEWTATDKSNDDFFANGMSIDGKVWRGLTKQEIEHIATGRTNATALRARATITGTGLEQLESSTGGITGVILLPDNFGSNPGFTLNAQGQWVFPYGFTLETIMSKPLSTSFADNVLTTYQWSMMQCLGCVFLPAAGKAGSQHVYVGGSLGSLYYWTAYYYNKFSETHRACYFYGTEVQSGDEAYGDCQQGFAVRLVR